LTLGRPAVNLNFTHRFIWSRSNIMTTLQATVNTASDRRATARPELTAVRVRFPIALKLTLASAALVMVLSVGFVVKTFSTTQEQYAQFARSRTSSEISALAMRGLSTARQLSDALYPPLLNGDIDLVNDTVQSVTKGNAELVEVIVSRQDGRVIARAGQGQLGEELNKELRSKLEKLDKVTQLDAIEEKRLPERIGFGAPIEVSVGETRRREGYLYLETSTERIKRALAEIEAERQRAVRSALIQTALLGLFALMIGTLIAFFQGFRFSGAIRHLAHVAAEVGAGNLKARARPTTRDEIGVLSVRFNDMTSHIESLLVESIAKAALDKELERANSIQALLMPPRDGFRQGMFSYCGWSETATQMGGDWWHPYKLSDTRVLICIGDVTGHGIPSAMLTATTKACCDTQLFQSPQVNFSKFMRVLDHSIRESGKGELVMTFFAAVFDFDNMTVEFANAGHNFPLLVREGQIKSLVARGGRLGDGDQYVSATQPIQSGDLIVMYTDGIIECENDKGEAYGVRRMRRILEKYAQADALELRERLLEDAYNFYGSAARKDDVTLVVCRIDPTT
jgi:phosphoserine phosphatase RsbU/P